MNFYYSRSDTKFPKKGFLVKILGIESTQCKCSPVNVNVLLGIVSYDVRTVCASMCYLFTVRLLYTVHMPIMRGGGTTAFSGKKKKWLHRSNQLPLISSSVLSFPKLFLPLRKKIIKFFTFLGHHMATCA